MDFEVVRASCVDVAEHLSGQLLGDELTDLLKEGAADGSIGLRAQLLSRFVVEGSRTSVADLAADLKAILNGCSQGESLPEAAWRYLYILRTLAPVSQQARTAEAFAAIVAAVREGRAADFDEALRRFLHAHVLTRDLDLALQTLTRQSPPRKADGIKLLTAAVLIDGMRVPKNLTGSS